MNRVTSRAVVAGLGCLWTATLFAACSTSSSAPAGGGAEFDSGDFDVTFGDAGVDGAATTLAECLAGVLSGPPPSACAPLVACLENATDAGCGADLISCFGPDYATGTIAGACAGFETCATQHACTPAAGVTCSEQTTSTCQQCVSGLVSCAATSCKGPFLACESGLLSGLYDAGMPGDASTGMDATVVDSGVKDSSVADVIATDSQGADSVATDAGGDASPGDSSTVLDGTGPDGSATGFGAVTSVSVGLDGACALTVAGGVVCWGANQLGQLGNNSTTPSLVPVQVSGLTSGALSVSVGSDSACAVTAGGGVVCWGYNNLGQLGNGSTTNSSVPVQVTGLTSGVTSVSVGYQAACAVTAGGGVVCWGNNAYGQLGNNSGTPSSVPVQVVGITSGATAVSIGASSACAVTAGGGVMCWGDGSNGRLGNGAMSTSEVPVQVSGLTSGVTLVSVGTNDACAVTAGGGLMCWGYDQDGELGNNSTTDSPVPVQVSGLTSGVTSVTVGQYSPCAVAAGGDVVCWGYNQDGELGNGSTTPSLTPVQVTGLTGGATTVSAGSGSGSACAVTACGVVCWGNAPLGNNSSTSSLVPVGVDLLDQGACPFGMATSVSAGELSSCATTGGGSVVCWGYNQEGELGDNSATSSDVPVQVTGLAGSAVSVGSQSACAVTASGGVVCWGGNNSGMLGDNSVVAFSLVPVQVTGLTSGVTFVSVGDGGSYSACAVAAGGLVCWGDNAFGHLGNNSTMNSSVPVQVTGLTSGVTSVSIGDNDTACAVTAGGGVMCWGYNGATGTGLLGNGDTTATDSLVPVQVTGLTSGATSVSVGEESACAVTGGAVVCWGGNTFGELGNGNTTSSSVPVQVTGLTSGVTSVSLGQYSACALTTSGAVMCWGWNGYGQLGNGSAAMYSSVPVQVTGLTGGATSVTAGYTSACAVVACGVVCWGENNAGQLGNNSTTDSSVPVSVDLLGTSPCP